MTTTTTTTVLAGYCGWLRTSPAGWRKVAVDPTCEEALTKLMQSADQTPGVHKDLIVLPADQTPRDRRSDHGRHGGEANRITDEPIAIGASTRNP
jgi:hypothetical protein